MPNYEYKCVSCDHIFELWQNVGEAAPQCPECGSDVKKVFHPPRVIFKGSGFYVTDLRAEKEGKGGASGETTASIPSTPAGSSTESKPAATSEAAASPAPATEKPAAPAASTDSK